MKIVGLCFLSIFTRVYCVSVCTFIYMDVYPYLHTRIHIFSFFSFLSLLHSIKKENVYFCIFEFPRTQLYVHPCLFLYKLPPGFHGQLIPEFLSGLNVLLEFKRITTL